MIAMKSRFSFLFSILSFFLIIICFIAPGSTIYAATSYIDPDGDGSIGSGWNSTGTNFYTEINCGTRQPDTPSTTNYVYGQSNRINAENIFFRMSSISNIESVSEITIWIYQNINRGDLIVQLYDDDEVTTHSSRVALTPSSNTWQSITFSGLSLAQSELDSLSIAIIGDHYGGGPMTNYIFAMYAEVTYTEAATVSISLTTDGSVNFGILPLDDTQDTTETGTNDVQTISVDAGPANLLVQSTNFSDGTNSWSLGTNNGDNQVLWEFSNGGSNWTTFSIVDTNYTFEDNVPQGETRDLFLRLTMPTSTSSYNQHSNTVTITATAP